MNNKVLVVRRITSKVFIYFNLLDENAPSILHYAYKNEIIKVVNRNKIERTILSNIDFKQII